MSRQRAAEILTPLNVRGVPELVVEIGSPGTRRRDETIKRHMYEREGVSEYWVVGPALDAIRVYCREPDADGFARPTELSCEHGDVLTTRLLDGLEMPLARIFREP